MRRGGGGDPRSSIVVAKTQVMTEKVDIRLRSEEQAPEGFAHGRRTNDARMEHGEESQPRAVRGEKRTVHASTIPASLGIYTSVVWKSGAVVVGS